MVRLVPARFHRDGALQSDTFVNRQRFGAAVYLAEMGLGGRNVTSLQSRATQFAHRNYRSIIDDPLPTTGCTTAYPFKTSPNTHVALGHPWPPMATHGHHGASNYSLSSRLFGTQLVASPFLCLCLLPSIQSRTATLLGLVVAAAFTEPVHGYPHKYNSRCWVIVS